MPYTPPSQRSPASSASASPDVSRRSSIQSGQRPALPRSASYLTKHRRTPSVTAVSDGTASPLTPQATEEDLPSMAAQAPSTSIRQSPPPRTDERGMPKGAIISPPESASSGSDDDGPEIRGRKSEQLRDLRDAVSQISQPRSASPAGDGPTTSALDALHTNGVIRISLSTPALADMPSAQRRSSHMRSATEPNASILKSAEQSVSVSEEDTDEDLLKKPQMVRKKSGELVRPALRPSSRRRPSSMPGTPVFSKAVHFDSHLEHVRHFLQVDRPLAVSAGSSPVENYDSDNEYPFDTKSGTRSPPYEWEILTTNFPHDNLARKSLPVRLEKVWLSPDQKTLLGSVAVANLAFQKLVVCRFTLDYWKTTSEVVAEYGHEIRPKETAVGCDRFNFSIKLADTANLESKTLFFCLRYSVGGQEFWDNNSSANFQVDFRKKHLPQNGKNSFRGASSRPLNGLPRSNRRTSSSNGLRPKSMPVTLDDFGDDDAFNFDQPIHEYLGESGSQGLRLKSKSTNNLGSDDLARGLSSPSGAAFANRYDFGASLSAAVQAAKDSAAKDKDTLYMKKNMRGPRPTLVMPESAFPIPGTGHPKPVAATTLASTAGIPGPGNSGSRPSNTTAAAPGAAAAPGTSSPSSIASSSYEELVNKYCFFGTKPTTSATDGAATGSGQLDGLAETEGQGTGSTNSASGSPLPTLLLSSAPRSASSQLYNPASYLHQLAFRTSPMSTPPRQSSPMYDDSNLPQASISLATSPALAALPATPPADVYHPPQQVLGGHFSWGSEHHAATAIRG